MYIKWSVCYIKARQAWTYITFWSFLNRNREITALSGINTFVLSEIVQSTGRNLTRHLWYFCDSIMQKWNKSKRKKQYIPQCNTIKLCCKTISNLIQSSIRDESTAIQPFSLLHNFLYFIKKHKFRIKNWCNQELITFLKAMCFQICISDCSLATKQTKPSNKKTLIHNLHFCFLSTVQWFIHFKKHLD